MASKCRRKQCQPRRIVRQHQSGSKTTISYLVVDKQESTDDFYNTNANSPLQCDKEQDHKEEHVDQHIDTLQQNYPLLPMPEMDTNANLINQETPLSNPFLQLPLSFESFQNAALINFAINQEILRKASLPQFTLPEGTLHCNLCGQVFNQQTTLDVHRRVYHSGIEFRQNGGGEVEDEDEEKYSCNECGKSFSHRWNLTQHMKAHDPQAKTFPCQYCDKVFSHDCNRRIHLRSHTGEKPFRCEMCGRRFSHKHNMRVHMRTHTREKPYQCPHCTKAFAHVSALKIHSRVHSGEKPYSCEDCGKEFSHSSTLNVHRRRHTGEKPFQCEVCEKTFSRDYILKNHLKTHTETDDISEMDT